MMNTANGTRQAQDDLFAVFAGKPIAPAQLVPEVRDPAEPEVLAPKPVPAGASNYAMARPRALGSGWKTRAEDNIRAMKLAIEIERADRAATEDEKEILARFVGFGATALANGAFRRPATHEFDPAWAEIGRGIEAVADRGEIASLMRTTQYAHFTPEKIVEALWAGVTRAGFKGGRTLEPGMGPGIMLAMAPAPLRGKIPSTGVERDPTTARIARILHPLCDVRCEDFAETDLRPVYSLAIGNPPFSSLVVRGDRAYRKHGFRLADYFLAKSVDALKPGGLAAFVLPHGVMDKAFDNARRYVAEKADLLAAMRLPNGSFEAAAGTDVCVDLVFLRRRMDGERPNGIRWMEAKGSNPSEKNSDGTTVNEYFRDRPRMVGGSHKMKSGQYGPTYACVPMSGYTVEDFLRQSLNAIPRDVFTAVQGPADFEAVQRHGANPAADGGGKKEGSYRVTADDRLMRVVDGDDVEVAIRGKGVKGMTRRDVSVVKALVGLRDRIRQLLAQQDAGQDWSLAQAGLNRDYDRFVEEFGAINARTSKTIRTAAGRESHVQRYPNLGPFKGDPDVWLVASVERYDEETGEASKGPAFDSRVTRPAAEVEVRTALDALTVTLDERGRLDIDHMAGLLGRTADEVREELGEEVILDPASETWMLRDAYLSGNVRKKLVAARAAAEGNPRFSRNVELLTEALPAELPPSAISAALGAPWIPTDVIEAFCREVVGYKTEVQHNVNASSWSATRPNSVDALTARGRWGTAHRGAHETMLDALNNVSTAIYETYWVDGKERSRVDAAETEAVRARVSEIKAAFASWIWTAEARSERLVAMYNEKYNNIAPRVFDGRHMTLPGSSSAFTLRDHQKRAVWRTLCDGSSYIAHAVGAGKSATIAAIIMEQKRLGLANKVLLAVPRHCLVQCATEFLMVYPRARILVADEENFCKAERQRFLARVALDNHDAVIITHSALKLIPIPDDVEKQLISEERARWSKALAVAKTEEDRNTTKRIAATIEALDNRIRNLVPTRDDFLSMADIGIDQIIVDEAHQYRKLSFATRTKHLKGVDPEGSMAAFDLDLKIRYLRMRAAADHGGDGVLVDRAAILASGTPCANTMAEIWTASRYIDPAALEERGVHNFDAWMPAFGEMRSKLELQPTGAYKLINRFAYFVNVPELSAMFRSFADVVVASDLRGFVDMPELANGRREIITSPKSREFADIQADLSERMDAIQRRGRMPLKGEDIVLSVMTDGRHAALDVRFVEPDLVPGRSSKLNRVVDNVLRIHKATEGNVYLGKDGRPMPVTGATQMVFCDLGTPSALQKRGFSAYTYMRDELVRRGVDPSQVAFVQDYKKASEKNRLFARMRAGLVRIVIGSTATMGTGVNAQNRMVALHHCDVPWLPAEFTQREGRILRQGNQNGTVQIYVYVTVGSMDSSMYQTNERKSSFIEAVFKGDPGIRRVEDIDEGDVSSFAFAKAVASGDTRLMTKAGLEDDLAKLVRQRNGHYDLQRRLRADIRAAEEMRDKATRRLSTLDRAIELRDAAPDGATLVTIQGQDFVDAEDAGRRLSEVMKEIVARSKDSEWRRTKIGQHKGIDIVGRANSWDYEVSYALDGETIDLNYSLGRSYEWGGKLFDEALERLEGMKDHAAAQRAECEGTVVKLTPMLGKFQFDDEIDVKTREIDAIDAELKKEGDAMRDSLGGGDDGDDPRDGSEGAEGVDGADVEPLEDGYGADDEDPQDEDLG